MKTCVVALLVVCFGGLAHATAVSCAGLAEGTSCATGDPCTTDDACVSGQCSPGAAVLGCVPPTLPDAGDSCKPTPTDAGTNDDKLKGGGGCSTSGGGNFANGGWLILLALAATVVIRRRSNAS
jgi:MYXO-CTERM domain-containing protein